MTQTEAMLVGMAILLRCEPQPNGCLVWIGARTAAGYGQIQRRKLSPIPLYVHRVIWIAEYGSIPEGMDVLHKCDNPPCVRVQHLFLGDDQANTNDKMAKGRHRHGHLYGNDHPMRKHPELVKRGAQHPMAKLTAEQVQQIRGLQQVGGSDTVIAKQFGVSRPTVSAIRHGRLWRNQ